MTGLQNKVTAQHDRPTPLRRKNIVYVASDWDGDLVRCERCEKKIRRGQRIVRWRDGIRTHEDCE